MSEPLLQTSSSQPAPRQVVRSRPSRDIVDDWCERGILGLVLAILVLGPLAFGAVDTLPLLVIQGLTAGVLLLWTARIWLSNSYRVLCPPVCWAVLAFMVYAGIRYGLVRHENGIEYLARQECLLVLVYGSLFFAVINNLSRQELVQTVTLVLLGLGTLISLYAVYQFLTKATHVWWVPQYPGYLGRASGTYMCPNHLAGFLEMLLPLGLAYTLTGRFKPASKVFIGYAAIAIFAGIGVSVSRGSWISIGAALLVFFGLLMRKRGRRLAGVIFFLLLIAAFYFFLKNLAVLQRRIHGGTNVSEAQDVRWELWQVGTKIWKENPWLGAGPGHFDERFRGHRPDDIQMRPLYAHNDYVNTLADWGGVGLALIGGTVVLLYLGVLQSWKYVQRSSDLSTKPSNRSAFVLGAAVALIAILVHSAVDFNMHIPANAILVVTLMALLAGHSRFASERHWIKLRWIGRPLLTLLCLAAVSLLAQQGVWRLQEHQRWQQASRARDFDGKLAALKAAHRVEPKNAETTYQIGEILRLASWEGEGPYREWAKEAIEWYERGVQLNRYNPYNYLRIGMCLHWLERHAEAAPYFEKALQLDPRNYYIQGHVGWHHFQLGELAEARQWFEKAVYQAHWHPSYRFTKYETGVFYLGLIDRLLAEKAAQPAR